MHGSNFFHDITYLTAQINDTKQQGSRYSRILRHPTDSKRKGLAPTLGLLVLFLSTLHVHYYCTHLERSKNLIKNEWHWFILYSKWFTQDSSNGRLKSQNQKKWHKIDDFSTLKMPTWYKLVPGGQLEAPKPNVRGFKLNHQVLKS